MLALRQQVIKHLQSLFGQFGRMVLRKLSRFVAALALGAATLAPVNAGAENFEASFDQAFGTQARVPLSFQANYRSPLEAQIARLADPSGGRIGVAAIDLATGEEISILGNQRFPMASTSKIAIAATFLEGVDKGRWTLDQQFPLMVPQPSKRLSTKVAPVKAGRLMSAGEMIERMIARSDNQATDGLLAVVGGPQAVNSWVRRAGISASGFSLDRDIATLVRDETEFDPAIHIDQRDSATPLAMAQMLKGLHEGRWLSAKSRTVLIGAMERCITGKNRIPGKMPANVLVAHKTGSLYNTSSDVGIITLPDGRSIALAIYVTGGKMDRGYRIDRIANIARALHDGFNTDTGRAWASASYGAGGSQ